MPIARLAPATNSIDITFTVSKELRPYLTAFYAATKKTGETPDDFVLRLLKKSARQWHTETEFLLNEEEIAADIQAFLDQT